jgi:hypothetical protein
VSEDGRDSECTQNFCGVKLFVNHHLAAEFHCPPVKSG